MGSHLAQLSAELLGEVLDEFLHDGVDLLVTHGLGLVLQDEVDGVRLLALRQVLAFVDVEETVTYTYLFVGMASKSRSISYSTATSDSDAAIWSCIS